VTREINLAAICFPSDDVVAREIDGELILVPLVSGIGDMEDELFTLNDTGRIIWNRLDGVRTLKQIASDLAHEYSAPSSLIESDVTGLVTELVRHNMVLVKNS